MRLLTILAALLLSSAVHATGIGLHTGTYDSDAQAYFNTLTANSCTAPSVGFKNAVSAYVVAEKTAGNWGNQDAEYLEATTDSCTASINLAQPGLYTITWTGSCSWAVQTGLNCDGSTGFGDTNASQSSLKRQSQNNGHEEVWTATNRGSAIGLVGNNTSRILPVTNKSSQLNSATTITDTGGGTAGLHFTDRTGSTVINTGLNGVIQSNGIAATSAALVAADVTICKSNATFCPVNTNILFAGFGQAMNNEAAHYTNVRNLLLALGVTGI